MMLLRRYITDLYRFIYLILLFRLCFSLKNNENTSSYRLGQYLVTIVNNPSSINNPYITISNDITSTNIDKEYNDNHKLMNENIIVWKTNENIPFIQLGNATIPRPPIKDGNYQLEESIFYLTNAISIEDISIDETSQKIDIFGKLFYRKDSSMIEKATYNLQLYLDDSYYSKYVRFHVHVQPDRRQLHYLQPRTFLNYWYSLDEIGFYGFGESFSYFNMKGYKVPILVSEQGVGRGEQPITAVLNKETPGVGGGWYTTYAPKPIYLTNQNRSLLLDNSEVMFFDLSDTTQQHRTQNIQIEIWAYELSGRFMQASSMIEIIELITEVTGRQSILPEWTQTGAIVGLEGGTANVTRIVESMYDNDIPLAGIWLQDWVGLQHSWDGDRLIWNWELNKDWYPEWDKMIASWRDRNTKVLTYISPFFSDPTAYSNSNTSFRHNFFQEGLQNGYFVKHSNGSTYLMYSLSIKFAMLDLTNPAAVVWMKNIIINQSILEGHSSGWMCDFGEYLPFDAMLYNGESASSYHNRFPEEWAKLTHEAVISASSATTVTSTMNTQHTSTVTSHTSRTTSEYESSSSISSIPNEQEVMFFMRSAWIKSPQYAPGDQLVSWDSNDGLRSVITGALSSGLTGHALTHSDIGGYTVETTLGKSMYYIRTPELLQRWTEMGAFGFALFRTHIGSSTTALDAQVYDNQESMAHFAKFASIYAHLYPLRKELMVIASKKGTPLIRPLAMHYGYDPNVWDLTEQYLVGPGELLVAPCLYEGKREVKVYFPRSSGTWLHIWSDAIIVVPDDAEEGLTVLVPAPIGFPPVFYPIHSKYGADLHSFLIKKSYVDKYHWIYQPLTNNWIIDNHEETTVASDSQYYYNIDKDQKVIDNAKDILTSSSTLIILFSILFIALFVIMRNILLVTKCEKELYNVV